uniref:C2H2-type domain-containing protein n=1 Tax=Lygus hesperus TaxID=30085 RepID=A0A0K8SS85_LYGHE
MSWLFPKDTEALNRIAREKAERESPYGRFKVNYLHPARDIVVGLLNDALEFDYTDVLWIFFFLGVVVSSMYLLYRCVRPRVVKGIYHFRGIHVIRPEAVMPGSPLKPGSSIPDYMVEVLQPGILRDTFMGYGMRIDEVLVMPMHVFASACSGDSVTLKGRTTLNLPLHVIESRRCNDIAYSLLDSMTWSKLGTKKATVLPTVDRSVPVTIFGREGTAAGYATKSVIPHVLNFSGSTLPGYSGSAYVSNGSAYGMHIGVAMDGNIGVSLESIRHEISTLIKGEKRRNPSNMFASNSYEDLSGLPKSKPKWTSKQAAIDASEEDLFDQYNEDPASRSKSFEDWLKGEASLTKELFDSFNDMSITQLESVINLAKNSVAEKKAVSKIYKTHGPDSFAKVLQVQEEDEEEQTESDVLAWCVSQITELRKEVSELKLRMENTGKPKQSQPKAFPCDKCSKSFASKLALVMHKVTKHTEGESAFPADHQVTEKLKPASFLGKTSPSMRRSNKGSNNTSATSVPGVASTSDMKSLSKTKPSPSQLSQYLEVLVQTISGLKAELQQ